MDELINRIKKYIEKRISQNPKETGHNVTEDGKETADIENQISKLGNNTHASYDASDFPGTDRLNQAVEAILKLISQEVTWKKPIRVTDQGFVSKSISTRETQEGLERQVEQPLIVAACGKVIKEEEIGVRCSVCNQYDCKEHAFLCNYCRRALCIVHTSFFANERDQNIPYCAEHYKKVVNDLNTWEAKEREISKRAKKT